MATLEWGKSFVSLDCLLEALRVEGKDELLDQVEPDKILHLPASLSEPLLARIEHEISYSAATRSRLKDLLVCAVRAPYQPLQRQLFSITFGDTLRLLLDMAQETSPIAPPPLEAVDPHEMGKIANDFQGWACNSPDLQTLRDLVPVPIYHLETIRADVGYAEYWPAALTGEGNDRLVLYENQGSLDFSTLLATLVHEVYPGHGFFYNWVARSALPFFDHGALTLIEGWATWCEWHFFRNPYADFTRSTRLRFLKTFDLDDSEQVINSIDLLRAERGALDSRYEQLNLFFQYPGYATSYALGALWFERFFTPATIGQFFQAISHKPVGDFFSLWSNRDAILFTVPPSRQAG